MAKSLKIKNKNDEILYPETVSALVYDDSTGNTVEEDIQGIKLGVLSKKNTSNKITELTGFPTDLQYPSAKCVYDKVTGLAPINNPAFTGIPTAPTALSGTNTTLVATTEFVNVSLNATLLNLQYFLSSNFGGFSVSNTEQSAISNIPSIFTNKGYTSGTTYWFLAGTSLETLKAYEYSGTGSPTLIADATYNFKDVNGVVEYVNERFRLLAMLLWHLVYTSNAGSSMAQQLYQLIQDGIENGMPVIANLDHIYAQYVGSTKYVGDGLYTSDFVVTAYYSDNTSNTVTAFTINPSVLSSTSNNVTISYGGKFTVVVVAAEEMPEGADVTMEVLGSSMGTVLYQNGAYVGHTPIASQTGNGIDITLPQILTTLYGRQGDYGGIMDGWVLNGNLIPSEVVSEPINLGESLTYTATTKATFIPQNGLLYPRLKGNLAIFKSTTTVNEDTLGTTKNDSNYARTSAFPMDYDQALTFRFPGLNLADTPSDSTGHYVNVYFKMWNSSGSSCLANSSNATRLYRIIRVLEDSNGLVYCPSHNIINATNITNNPNNKRLLVSLEPKTGSGGNSSVFLFTESQVRKMEIGYADTEWFSCPPFKIDDVVSFGDSITWSTTGSRNCPRSCVYHNGYVVTIGDELRDVIVTDVENKTKVTLHPHTYTSEWANFRGSTSGFLSFKYDESDFYPLLVAAWGYSAAGTSPYISVFRLNGSATNFTMDEVCRWTSPDSYAHIALDKLDNLYLLSKDLTAGTNGVYKLKTITSSDLVNLTLSVSGSRLSYQYGHSNICDTTFASDNGEQDLLVSCINRSGENFPVNVFTVEKLGTTSTDGAMVVLSLPLHNRLINEWLRGVCYAGNGVYYLNLVTAEASSGSNHSGRLIKLTIPRPILA